MKKIGVLTTSGNGRGVFACNYGAALQGFALVKFLRNFGFDAYDINYSSEKGYDPKEVDKLTRTKMRIKLLFNKKILKNKINSVIHAKDFETNRSLFESFVKSQNLTYNNGKMYSLEGLSDIADDFYAFVAGSDVIWNPYIHNMENDKGFFLDFVPKGVKRIAYAPSIGASTLPDSSKKDFKKLVSSLDAISIREETGAKLIMDETGLKAEVVLDPTLLINPKEYESITKVPSNLPKEYIAVYKFGRMEDVDRAITTVIKEKKLPTVFIPSGKVKGCKTKYDLGPMEFIGTIKNAKLVLTDSFHCVVFCLVTHTPFFVFSRVSGNSVGNINSRVSDLLKRVGLSERFIDLDKGFDINNFDAIDFEKIDKKLEELRKDSEKFLLDALEYNK